MDVLVLGENEVNTYLFEKLETEGLTACHISDVSEIVSIRNISDDSACETFSVHTNKDEFDVASIIVTEPPVVDDVVIGGMKTYSIMDDTILDKLKAVKAHEKIVILLDYVCESPEHVTVRALQLAKKLVDRKREVCFVSNFVRTASFESGESTSMEEQYRNARASGVTFIKCNKTEITFNEEKSCFAIKIHDGVIETNISTPYVVSVGNFNYSNIKYISNKLRLTSFDSGLLNEDRFFLHKILTSKKHVYYLNPSVTATSFRVADSVDQYLTENDFACDLSHPTVNIDGRKCAFCYSCYRACPHSALEPDLENSAMVNNFEVCQACGICVSVCPAEAITMDSDIDFVKPSKTLNKCKVFCCENGAKVALDEISDSLGETLVKLDITPVPCGGRISVEMITDALYSHDKVLIAVCMDDACRHFAGGKRACKQLDRTIELLQKAKIDESLVKCVKVSHAMKNVLKDNILEFIK